MILAIDGGQSVSGYCIFYPDKREIIESGVKDNAEMLKYLQSIDPYEVETLVIEEFSNYNHPVGKEVIDSIIWSGRFQQAWHTPEDVVYISRRKVLSYLAAKNDATVRAALISLLDMQPVKGKVYQVVSHCWSALALCVTHAKTKRL